jgi:hypothetical protein
LTKESYAKYLLSAKSVVIIFVFDESGVTAAIGKGRRIAASCDIG